MMYKRTDRLYDVGTLPEPGVLPEYMYAWCLRNDSLGEPIKAFREEIVPVPSPGAGEVIVANMSAGINYNGVWAALGKPKNVVANNGTYSDEKQDFHICGSEASGIVYAVGEGVENVRPGDRVIVGASQYDRNCPIVRAGGDPVSSPTYRVWGYEGNWGAFAQFSKVMDYQCRSFPECLSWSEAASFTAAGAAVYRMLTHWPPNNVKAGDVVLVYGGTGGVGSMAIQLARHFGAVPIAVVSDDKRGEFCKTLGAAGYINRKNYHHWGRLGDYTDEAVQRKWSVEAARFRREIWKIAGSKRSPDIVIEHPGADTLPTSLFVCAPGGMVVLCGATSSYHADIDLRFLWLSQKRIQGSHSATPEDYKEYVKIIEGSGIRPFIGRHFEWSQLPEAHQLLMEGKAPTGKLVIDIVQ